MVHVTSLRILIVTGYNMAKNLRQKIPATDTLYIQDVNSTATSNFVQELAGHSVVVAKSAREVAEKAVRLPS